MYRTLVKKYRPGRKQGFIRLPKMAEGRSDLLTHPAGGTIREIRPAGAVIPAGCPTGRGFEECPIRPGFRCRRYGAGAAGSFGEAGPSNEPSGTRNQGMFRTTLSSFPWLFHVGQFVHRILSVFGSATVIVTSMS